MALTAKLALRQGQHLVMTPQLQQAIRLLQLSNLELSAFIDKELEQNPLLERDDGGEPPNPRYDGQREAAATAAANGAVKTPINGAGASRVSARSGAGSIDLEAFAAALVSLKDHLTEQMRLALTNPVERLIAYHLIDLVDEAGYLSADFGQLADKLGAPAPLVEKVLVTLQGCGPCGVLARSLEECLALQLKEQNRYDPQIAALLQHLDLVAAHNLAGLQRVLGVEIGELADMIAEIKRLNPKPGLKFGAVQIQPIIPDVMVRADADGGWIVELNSDTLPRVLVDRSYYARVAKTARSAPDKDYLHACLQTANWLVKSLDQRARTILRVADEIVRRQDGFLTHGVTHLRPLNLKTVADALGMHESTVSRVTANKYMATPRGIFQLKYFFTSAIACAETGQAHSSEAVRHHIKQLIDAETAEAVLSDDKVVARLRAEGIDIARRTVAKYREAMRIPSSAQRRRAKRLIAHAAGPARRLGHG